MKDKIKFSEYFNAWLYSQDAYYSTYKTIGKEGDFFTAVSTSSLFGGSLGKKIVDTINEKKLPQNTTIVEIGAHHGYLMADMIQYIYTLNPKLLDTLTFAIVERFPKLQEQQKKYLFDSFGNNIKIKFYNHINEVKLNSAFIVANEIFDAFACELLYTKDNILQQAFVDKNHKIEFFTCEDEYLIREAKKYNITKGELGIEYEAFAKTLIKNIKKFEFISFDYGDKYPRNDFSSRIYAKHTVYPLFEKNLNLKALYKNSDLTYDVHFNRISDIFKKQGASELIFKTQLQALVDFGIIDLLEMIKINAGEDAYLREVQKAKTLLEPTGMGDRFKMLHIRK